MTVQRRSSAHVRDLGFETSSTEQNAREKKILDEQVWHARRFDRVLAEYEECYRIVRTAEELRGLQTARLARLLTTLTVAVPYYRGRIDGELAAADPFSALALLPLSDKLSMEKSGEDRFADEFDPGDCLAVLTSGTTGIPQRIVLDSTHFVHRSAHGLQGALAAGLGLDRKSLKPFRVLGSRWFEYTSVQAGFVRTAEFGFPAASGAAARGALAARCVEFAPDVIQAPPHRCLLLMELLREAGHRVLPVRQLATFGETLTAPVRASLERFFGPVRDTYGMCEFGPIATQCSHGSYHISSERLWVEVIDEAACPVPDGVAGEIVATNLLNAVAPFVRYRTGDTGALSPARCPCGAPQKVLKLLEGRRLGLIHFADGSRLDAARVVRTVERFPLSRLQVVQDDLRSLRVLVQPLRSSIDTFRDALAAALDDVVEKRIVIVILDADDHEFVLRKDAKIRSFISSLEPDPPAT